MESDDVVVQQNTKMPKRKRKKIERGGKKEGRKGGDGRGKGRNEIT